VYDCNLSMSERIPNAQDCYAQSDLIQERLVAAGLSEWGDRLFKAARYASTGTEALTALRWNLEELARTTALDGDLPFRVRKLISDISALIHSRD
jgi:hypothetical protein